MRFLVIACLLTTAVAMPATAEIIETILYTPTSLPSAQGWTYEGLELEEHDVFSLVDGVLVMDTMGTPMQSLIQALYKYDTGEFVDAQGAVIRWRARVTDSESMPHTYHHGFGFSAWSLTSWFQWYWFSLDLEHLYTGHLPSLDLDTSVWHDYVLTCSHTSPDSPLELYIDGQQVAYHPDEHNGAIRNTIFFGDRGWLANARVEIAEIEITLTTDAPVQTHQTTLSHLKSLFQ